MRFVSYLTDDGSAFSLTLQRELGLSFKSRGWRNLENRIVVVENGAKEDDVEGLRVENSMNADNHASVPDPVAL